MRVTEQTATHEAILMIEDRALKMLLDVYRLRRLSMLFAKLVRLALLLQLFDTFKTDLDIKIKSIS